jgi:hypothetical protein
MRPCTYLSILPICLASYLSKSVPLRILSIYLFVQMSLDSSVDLSAHITLYLSVCLPGLPIFLSIVLSIFLFIKTRQHICETSC